MPAEILFDRSLYLPEAVQAAAAAYADYAAITLEPSGNALKATITAHDAELAEAVVNGFCNHALHETILRRRRTPDGEGA